MNKLEKEITEIINKDELKLGNYIEKKLRNKLFQRRNKKEVFKLLPTIIEHTNKDNSDWLFNNKNFSFIKEPAFLDILIENLEKFNFQKSEYLLINLLSNIFEIIDLTDEQAKKLIDKLIECDCNLYTSTNLLYLILKRNHPKLIRYMLKKYIINIKTCEACLEEIKKSKENIDLISENLDFILDNINTLDLISLKKFIKDNKEDEDTDKKIKNKIEINPKESIIITLKNKTSRFFGQDNNSKINEFENKKEYILEIVYLIIEDICKNENTKISDIEELGRGTFSTVFGIGNKVIKIGSERETKTFPNNPYIVAPLLRKEFPIINDISFFVEVNEKVDTKSYINEEELYQLYKKLRDINLIWSDVAYRNVGRLLKDNQVYWRQHLPLTDERLGLQPYIGDEFLKKGDLVILDSDHIYDESLQKKYIEKYSTDLQKNLKKDTNEKKD